MSPTACNIVLCLWHVELVLLVSLFSIRYQSSVSRVEVRTPLFQSWCCMPLDSSISSCCGNKAVLFAPWSVKQEGQPPS